MGIGRPAGTTQASGMIGDVLTRTNGDLTYYVRSAGDDGNSGFSASDALATIQEAVDRVPKFIQHDVIVDIGVGNFAGFEVAGFTVPRYIGSFTIQGTLGNPTLTTGTVSGTADSGTTTQLVDDADPGQSWTINELRGMLVKIGSEYRVVRNNTADTINFIGPFGATCSGKAYEIFEQKTVINSAAPSYASTNIWVTANQTGRDNGILFSDLKSSGNTYTVFHQYGTGINWRRMHLSGGTANLLVQSTSGEIIVEDCYSNGGYYGFGIVENGGQVRIWRNYDYGSNYGFYLFGNGAIPSATRDLYSDNSVNAGLAMGGYAEIYATNIFAENGTAIGVLLGSSKLCQITNLTCKDNGGTGLVNRATPTTLLGTTDLSSNGGWGVELSGNSAPVNVYLAQASLDIQGTATIESNTSGGIFADLQSIVILDDVDGTNTGSYGLELKAGSYALVTSNTGITGGTGNAVIDGEAFTWATDFSSDGDVVMDLTSGCRIERRD